MLTINRIVAKLVVGGPLLGVSQHFIGFRGFLEFIGRVGIILVAIRMIFHRHSLVGFLDFALVGSLGNPEHFIIISFRHSLRVYLLINTKAGVGIPTPALSASVRRGCLIFCRL